MNRKRKKKFPNKRLKSNTAYTELNQCLFNEPIVSIIEKINKVNKFIFKFGSYQVCDFGKR